MGATGRQTAPSNGYAAKFAVPYLLAAGFVHGGVGLSGFTNDASRPARADARRRRCLCCGECAQQSGEADAVAGEIEAAGGKALVHIGDVADAVAVQAMADAAVKQFSGIDILVNNAALRRETPLAEMDYAAWREILDVTLDGTFHCVKACLPALRRSGSGTIVNIGGLSA